jgi:tetratricopeptide (TPR) repeat protein
MKKIIALLVFFAINSILIAQTNKLSMQEFAIQATSMEKSISENFKSKDYETLNKLLDEAIALFYRLSDEDQETYKMFQANNYYNLACAYSLQGKKTEAIDAFEKSVKDWNYINYSCKK